MAQDGYRVLVLGAAYGLLPAVRIGLAGHSVTVVCREDERQALAARGAVLELRRRDGKPGRVLALPAAEGPGAPGRMGLAGPGIDPGEFDIAFLAMGEPQFAAPEIAALMARIGAAGVPVVSVMNLPPAAWLRRLPGLDVEALRPAFGSWEVWQGLDPSRVTATSPDAQALRLDPATPERLTVTLASNFKVAPFARAEDQVILARLAEDVSAFRMDGLQLPVRLVAQEALHIPLAKWPMLLAGNCRCILPGGATRSICEAVRSDLAASRAIYERAVEIVCGLGADPDDLVPFASYASATLALTAPSSLARALAAGAQRVERVDLLLQLAGRSLGISDPAVDAIVATIEAQLARNRAAQRAG